MCKKKQNEVSAIKDKLTVILIKIQLRNASY